MASALRLTLALGAAVGALVPSARAYPAIALLQAGAAEAVAAGEEGSEEVVVTAQRRAQRLVDTPITVFAATGEAMATKGITVMQDLPQLVPGLRMDANGLAFQPTIRGIGSAISGPGDHANVATYVDGFYRPSMNSNNMKFSDIASVQVLKGPQGTLFGRNATGGAMLITSEGPEFDFSATGRLSYSSYNTFNAGMYATGPLSETVAASVSAFVSSGDGSVTNILTDDDEVAAYTNWGVRGKVRWDISDKASFTLTYEHNDVDDPTFIAYNAYNGWSLAQFTPGAVIPSTRGRVALDGEPITTVENDGFFLKGEFDLGWSTLTSYTSAINEEVFNQLDMDGSNQPIQFVFWDINEDTYTQEFNLASKGDGPLSWVAGLYYFNDNQYYTDFEISVFGSPLFVAFAYAGQHTVSAAAFVDGTYQFNDKLFLTLGLRYSYDHITERFILGESSPAQTHSADFYNLSPRAVLRYEISDDSSVYASYSQGYKAGVFNVFGAASEPVDPEIVNAFEVGYKTASDKWDFEGSVFYYDYQDLQINTYIAFTSQLVNASNSEIYGIDANLTGRITDELTVNVAAAYTHARYKDFPNDPSYTWDPDLGVVIGTIDGDGLYMQRTPTFQASVGLTYSTPLGGGMLDLIGNYAYQTKVYFDPANVTYQDSFGILNLRASWTNESGNWTVAVFGNNVTDETYISQVLPVAVAFNQSFGEPATFGAEIRFDY